MNRILDHYGAVLNEVDDWFSACLTRHPGQIMCHQGCSACCRGLFDITLLDALYMKRGLDLLPARQSRPIQHAALRCLTSLSQQFPFFTEPWLLNTIPEANWEQLMPEEDDTPCLLLSDTGNCLIYEHRPMTCRLNGIPLIDTSGEELFDEWCTLNFAQEEPRRYTDLRFGFTQLFAQELLLFQELARIMTGVVVSEIDLFIPAAIVLELNTALPAIKALAVQSTATTKFPGNPLRS